MFKCSIRILMFGLLFVVHTTIALYCKATNSIPAYSSAFLENKSNFLKVPSTSFLVPIPKFILRPGLFVQKHPLITLGLAGLTGLVAYGVLAYKILDRYYGQNQPKKSKQSNDTMCKTFFGKFKTMPTLNKMRALLLSPLIFGYSFIYPETWREFAESLDLIHPSQEIKKEEKFEKKIEQKIEEKKLEQIEEKKIEDVGIELTIDPSVKTNDFVETLNKAENIATLKISNNNNIDFNSTTIPWDKLTNLKKLSLSGGNIDGKVLNNFITKCSHIENLALFDCEKIIATEIEKVEWKKLKNLKQLDLSWMNIEDAGLKNLIEKCLNLEALTIYACKKITKKGFENLSWNALKKLENLKLSYLSIEDAELKALIEKCCCLKNLRLDSCENITDEGFKNIDWTELSKNLKELDLGSTKIGDDGLKKIFGNKFVNLIELSLHRCYQITKNGFESLTWTNVEKLEKLSLCNTSVSNAVLGKILKHCKSLNFLSLEGCENISEMNRKIFKSEKEIKNINIA